MPNEKGFYDMTHTKVLKSARMKDASEPFLKVIERIRNPVIIRFK